MKKLKITDKKQRRKIKKLHADTLFAFAGILDEMLGHLLVEMRAGFGLDKCAEKIREAARKLEE